MYPYLSYKQLLFVITTNKNPTNTNVNKDNKKLYSFLCRYVCIKHISCSAVCVTYYHLHGSIVNVVHIQVLRTQDMYTTNILICLYIRT